MNNYDVKQINEYTYLLNDADLCTSYLIIGENKALLIDTGEVLTNNLQEEVRKITNKELIVALTHGHYDHIRHVDEFDSFYMSLKDEVIVFDSYKKFLCKAIDIKENMTFDLGGITIDAFLTCGHTPGTVIFIDKKAKIAYTGDQFGSGCGVWMQVSGASILSEYIKEIDRFIAFLRSYGYDENEWTLYGGHYGQELTSRLSKYNPLTIELVKNLKKLSIKLINNEIKLVESNAKQFENEQSYYCYYKNAEMIIRKSLIK